MRYTGFALALTAIGSLSVPPVRAATHRVPSEFPTINAALGQSTHGDTVLVAPGTYADTEVRSATRAMAFLVDGVTLIGEGGADATVLDLRQVPWGAYAFVGTSLDIGPTVIEGFTFQGNKPAASSGVSLSGTGALIVKSCKFQDFDEVGPGHGNGAVSVHRTDRFRIVDCEFDTCWGRTAGAIRLSRVSGQVERCAFRNCRGAIALDNGAYRQTDEQVEIRDCVFDRSQSNSISAIVINSSQGSFRSALVERCVFRDLSAPAGGAVVAGTYYPTEVILRGNTFLRCSAPFGGGAVRLSSGINVVTENTFIECSVPTGGAGSALLMEAAPVELTRNLFWKCTGAPAAENLGNPRSVRPACNVFWANPAGNAANFDLSASDRDVDPLLCYPADGGFGVARNSPCLSENSAGCGRIGAWGAGCGAQERKSLSWGQIKGTYR